MDIGPMNAPTKENIFKGFLIDIIFKILFRHAHKSVLKNDRRHNLFFLEIQELEKTVFSISTGVVMTPYFWVVM